MAQQPIVIVGAGIAGLTLGRCLKQKGIPTVLLERYTQSPRHTYGMTIHPWAYGPLLKAINMDETTFRQQTDMDSSQGGVGQIRPGPNTNFMEHTSSSFFAHRSRLEKLIGDGLDIKWDHLLKDATLTPKGVSLSLPNGKTIESSFVISTEGVHAQVRRSLLPDAQLKVLPFVVFNGKRRVKESRLRSHPCPLFQGHECIGSTMR